MPTSVIASSKRSGFVLGLSTGLVLASAAFLIRGELAATVPATTMAAPAKAASDIKVGSMQTATLALKTRLAAEGGPDDQWELLAQSYDFLGRSAEAKLAREHKTSASTDLRDAIAVSTMLLPAARAMASGGVNAQTGTSPAATLIASAEHHRRKREFKEACADYAGVLKLGAMTADTWADYADAQASLTGQLAGDPAKAIDRALALDPRHTKALWLKASLAHEQHRYKEALTTWQQLLTLVPAGSSDARIVEANMAEASRLATS
jgi:cytochrome c-type biogenesis protein CcmH/NrfG